MREIYTYHKTNLTNVSKRLLISTFIITAIVLWIMGKGTLVLLNEFNNTGIIGVFGIISLSIWFILFLLWNSIYISNPLDIEGREAWVTPVVSLFPILVSFSMLFIFSSVRNIMFYNIYLDLFWKYIIIFNFSWFVIAIRREYKK